MATLLYVQASPRGKRSKSIAVADAFVDAYRAAHADAEIATVNLFERDLPTFAAAALEAKYAILHQTEPTPEQRAAWAPVEALIREFTEADRYLFAVPMWNFGIPYRLKHYIDLLVQPTYTFAYDPETGYSGLVSGRAVVVYASGGDYSSEGSAAYDQQKPYVSQILGFMGITDVQSIAVQPTLMGGPEAAEQAVAGAIEEARRLATQW